MSQEEEDRKTKRPTMTLEDKNKKTQEGWLD